MAIELVADTLPEKGRNWVDSIILEKVAAASVINRIELLGFSGPESELAVLEELIQAIPILPLDEAVVLRTIEVRKQCRIKLPDAIIAATALVHNLTVVSRNERDFGRVDGLEHLNPHNL